MFHARNSIAAAALIAALAIAAGCARTEGNLVPDPGLRDIPDTARPRIYSEGVFENLSDADLQKYQPDVRLAAQWYDGYLWVAVRNRTNRPIEVHPAHFGVILLPEEKVVPVRPGSVDFKFPATTLAPGAMASGRFRFTTLGNLVGAHCYFSRPSLRPSRCKILPKPGASTPSGVPPR